jgi:hypothetical protein
MPRNFGNNEAARIKPNPKISNHNGIIRRSRLGFKPVIFGSSGTDKPFDSHANQEHGKPPVIVA